MAPFIYPRQFHSFPPPRPPKGPPGTPVMVTRYISFDVFVQLLVGTVCIFIIGVLAWKAGKLLRFLSRDNVVREGRSPYTRYARTWYGWVPQPRHEANKSVFRNTYEKYKRCTAWKSTHTDYAWVWWDPGQRGQKAYHEDRRRPLRWLPKCFRSYEPTAADTIWNPGPPPAPAALSEDSLPGRSAGLTTIASGDGDARKKLGLDSRRYVQMAKDILRIIISRKEGTAGPRDRSYSWKIAGFSGL
ncbi:hypothetical protein PHISP_00029 [Aspergillus sp. HF37]|nr:hypothetical protein PHISP_00029 [Aspergillus sp. HF37]